MNEPNYDFDHASFGELGNSTVETNVRVSVSIDGKPPTVFDVTTPHCVYILAMLDDENGSRSGLQAVGGPYGALRSPKHACAFYQHLFRNLWASALAARHPDVLVKAIHEAVHVDPELATVMLGGLMAANICGTNKDPGAAARELGVTMNFGLGADLNTTVTEEEPADD